jgi:protein-S-isoprenylcysteine O-methyltransferase Ste14
MQQFVPYTLLVIWAGFFAYWIFSAVRDRSPYKRKSSRSSLLTLAAVPAFLWLFILGQFAPWLFETSFLPDTLIVAVAGILITLCGAGFAIWARIHLGKNWSGQPAIRVNQKIVRTGPYSIVRHPIYTGLLIGVAGAAIATGSITALSVLAIIFVVFILKSRMEEKFLREEFGEEYEQYRREVKGLIPFVI